MVFTFLPGIISLIVIDALTIHKKWDKLNYLLYAFVLGLVNYGFWFLLSRITFLGIKDFGFLKEMISGGKTNVNEVVFVTIFLSVPVGFLLTYIIKYKLLYRFAKLIRAKGDIGDLDIWSFVFNAVENEKTDWVVIRDYENDRIYEGKVVSYSSSDIREKDELFMVDVKIYVNSTAVYLYQTPGMYFAAERGKIAIEFPNMEFESEIVNKEVPNGKTTAD